MLRNSEQYSLCAFPFSRTKWESGKENEIWDFAGGQGIVSNSILIEKSTVTEVTNEVKLQNTHGEMFAGRGGGEVKKMN